MNENYDGFHHQKATRTFIYTKSKKIAKLFYVQKARQFSKKKTIAICFCIQKAIHLTLQDFYESFVVGIYIQKA